MCPTMALEVLKICPLPSFIRSKYTGSKTKNILPLAWSLEFEVRREAGQ